MTRGCQGGAPLGSSSRVARCVNHFSGKDGGQSFRNLQGSTMVDPRRFLERKLKRLELHPASTMSEAVAAYFARVRSGTRKAPRWTPDLYPCSTEKELYAEMAYIFLAQPVSMLRAFLDEAATMSAANLGNASLHGTWRAFRISTARPGPRNRYKGPRIFSGGAGYGSIADIGLFLNLRVDPLANPCLRADKIIYFELKSSDRARHDRTQLASHLKSLEEETAIGVGYLAAIGGRPLAVEHPRWLGHVSLDGLLNRLGGVAKAAHRDPLAEELRQLRVRRATETVVRCPKPIVQPPGFARG
jgi:hypothetical protein